MPRSARELFVRAAGDRAALVELLTPDHLDRHPRSIQVGDFDCRSCLVHDFATAAAFDLASLLGSPGDLTHGLYFVASDPLLVNERFGRKRSQLQTNTLFIQDRGVVTDCANGTPRPRRLTPCAGPRSSGPTISMPSAISAATLRSSSSVAR